MLANGGGSSLGANSPVDAIALVSARTGAPLGRIEEVHAPLQSAFYHGVLWNLSSTGILSKIDPQTGNILDAANTVPVPCGLAIGGGALWVSDCSSPTVVRIDPTHDLIVGRTTLPTPRGELADATQSIATGAGSIWVGQGFDNPSYVWRLDLASGRVQHRYVIPEGGAETLAFGNGALWVGGGAIGRLSRIDPSTHQITTPARDVGKWLCCVAAGGGYVWAAVNPGGTIWKLSEDGEIISSVKLRATVGELDYADGAVWAAAGEAGTLVRIDPTTDATRSYRLGHNVVGSTVRAGVLAVALQPADKDVTAGMHGRIATVALAEDVLDATSTDPLGVQFAFNPTQVEFHYATCAKLFNYPDATGAAGEKLVPEVARGLPTVSDGGRVYTFRIRAGYGFSPPSDEQVTAESFRHALERFLSPAAHSFDPLRLLGDVVGARAYAAGEAPRVAGISAHGDTLAIHLTRAASDLPARLALPLFCAVPTDLPTVPHGLPYPIPSAGPYYLADRSRDVLVLKQNPNYHGPRPRRLDAIVYEIGIDPGLAADGIARGRFDYMASQDAVLLPATVAARTAGRRYRLIANNWTQRLALNTARPAFSDATVRRAFAYALDRRRLARALTNGAFQLPTSALLPPNLRTGGRQQYSLTADLQVALRLMRGRHIHIVFAADADEAGRVYEPRVALTLRRELAAVGIRLTIVPLRQTLDPGQRNAILAGADLAQIQRNADDARDPVQYLLQLPYLGTSDRARIANLESLPAPQRASAATAAAVRLERAARYVAYADAATPELVSKRLGCLIDHPEYPGLDLAALCLARR